jgi:hypothetical protein
VLIDRLIDSERVSGWLVHQVAIIDSSFISNGEGGVMPPFGDPASPASATTIEMIGTSSLLSVVSSTGLVRQPQRPSD